MIKAIETKYKGYRFRSRLEARWAVFFDALGLQWEYEPEGFDLGGGVYYLPDFRVEVFGAAVYVEVKGGVKNGVDLSVEDRLKILSLVEKMGMDDSIYVLGDLPKAGQSHIFTRLHKHQRPYTIFQADMVFWYHRYGITEEAGAGMWRVCSGFKGGGMCPTIGQAKNYADDYSLVISNYFVDSKSEYESVANAYDQARSARFEHGEVPTVK